MSRPIAAIDIGNHTIRVVAGEVRDDKINLLARSSAQSQGVRGGYITNKGESTIAIKKALRLTEKQIGQQIEDVYITAGGGPLSVKTLTSSVAVSHGDSYVTETDIDNAVRRSVKKSLGSNQRNIDAIILGYKLDGTETVSEPLGMRGKKLDVSAMLFNYASQNMDAAEDVLDSLEMATVDFFPGIIASSIVTLSTIDRKVGCILIDIGSDATSYIVYEHDAPLHVGYIPTGSDSVTQAIALEYQIPVSEAEMIKQGGPLPEGVNQDKLDVVVRKQLGTIFKQINAELKEIDKHANLPGGAVLCGGGALVRDVEEVARDILKIPTRKASVRAFKREGGDRELPWASVYGTVIQAMEQERSRSNNPIGKAFRMAWQYLRRFSA